MTKILLTGGTGMVGQNIVEAARARGVAVFAPTRSELNLLDFDATLRTIERIGPDIIVHAAGRVGGIQANIAAPVAFLVDNWDMGRNLVLAARDAGVCKMINLGSSCMYPKNSPDPLTENEILSGTLEPTNEGYALAKCSVARLCLYVGQEDPNCQYKTLVPCNIFGRFDKFDPLKSHLVPAIIHKVHAAVTHDMAEVEIWGDGTARREFMYASDLADAVLYAIGNFEAMPAVMNCGLGYDHTVNEYYQAVAEVIGYSGAFRHDMSKPVGMQRKLLDVTKQTAFGWRPKSSLRDGIKATYEFYISMGYGNGISAR